MYTVERAQFRAGRDTIVVTSKGKRVGGASVRFVQWMHQAVPKNQLRAEQIAMVEWYNRHA